MSRWFSNCTTHAVLRGWWLVQSQIKPGIPTHTHTHTRTFGYEVTTSLIKLRAPPPKGWMPMIVMTGLSSCAVGRWLLPNCVRARSWRFQPLTPTLTKLSPQSDAGSHWMWQTSSCFEPVAGPWAVRKSISGGWVWVCVHSDVQWSFVEAKVEQLQSGMHSGRPLASSSSPLPHRLTSSITSPIRRGVNSWQWWIAAASRGQMEAIRSYVPL